MSGRAQLRLVPRPPEPYRPVPAESCDVGWKCPKNEPPMTYPDGDYCGHHARMMTPRGQWPVLGIPPPPRAGGAKAEAGATADGLDLEAQPG